MLQVNILIVKKNVYLTILKEYDGRLSFATDTWTSPNQRAFAAITVHFEHKGEAISMLLDIVEVAKSHTGDNLAAAFAQIMEDYGISEKVLISCTIYININLISLTRFLGLHVITQVTMIR